MNWICNLSRRAAKQLRGLPRNRQKQLARAIEEMEKDPTTGDVRPIKSGKFKGSLRKRVGRYRIVFLFDPSAKRVEIAAIITRTGKTYH
jgi:mRNA-degrading endonuclease RelE of RelBE toxin-antitoxin system